MSITETQAEGAQMAEGAQKAAEPDKVSSSMGAQVRAIPANEIRFRPQLPRV